LKEYAAELRLATLRTEPPAKGIDRYRQDRPMIIFCSVRGLSVRFAIAAIIVAVLVAPLRLAVAGGLLNWQPVRIGAGGFVTGFVTHLLDPNVRYCRTDVGNAYRWDNTHHEWIPMLVSNHTGAIGMPASAAPVSAGVESIALDPENKKVVFIASMSTYSADVPSEHHAVKGSVFKSVDGGRSFVGSDLDVDMNANSSWRGDGERMAVDPSNDNIVYYGTDDNGLWRSVDGGSHWSQVTENNAPGSSKSIIGVRFNPASGTVRRFGQLFTRELWALSLDGTVFNSDDGGNRWTNNLTPSGLNDKCASSTVSSDGTLWVVQDNSETVWKYSLGTWTSSVVDFGWGQNLNAVAVDPRNVERLWAIGAGGALSRSENGGKTWTPCYHNMVFGNKLGWLPQATSLNSWRSNGGIYYDSSGTLWIPEGNEGILNCVPSNHETNTIEGAPHWMIQSQGIEEFVTHDVIIPPGGNPVVAVEDATGFVLPALSNYSAFQIPLQNQLISCGTGLAYCPNDPTFLAIVTADNAHTGSGLSYSGYSANGGKTWTPFLSSPVGSTGNAINQPGSIAISRRGGWGLGGDHLVWLPCGNWPAYWSHNGGTTWHASTGFPSGSGYWSFALKQRDLKADPFVPDKFYYVASWSGGCYVSNDGGESWSLESASTLPKFTHHGQLEVNRSVQNDLWFVDGWEGASAHGLWHSSDGGRTFVKTPFFSNAITLALGTSGMKSHDKAYSVYVYGRATDDSEWGIFRSNNGGISWERISYYPAGIFDIPTCLAASWDSYDKVIVGFAGNSFVYGE
jgi:photosystem II stability/assembly factor-like uncharacterized protein